MLVNQLMKGIIWKKKKKKEEKGKEGIICIAMKSVLQHDRYILVH